MFVLEEDFNYDHKMLYHLISDISEDIYCAGWMEDIEHDIFDMIFYERKIYFTLQPYLKQALIDLHRRLDGWITWTSEETSKPIIGKEYSGPVFVDSSTWDIIHKNREKKTQMSDQAQQDLLKIRTKLSEERACPILICFSGSRLYGTAGKGSDRDYTGVFIPSKEDMFLQKAKKVINLKDHNLDVQLHSVSCIRDLLLEGNTKAIEMLFIPDNELCLYKSELWDVLVDNKKLFLSKKIFNFLKFANSQAIKYGVKGDRYNTLNKVISVLQDKPEDSKVGLFFDEIPRNNHTYLIDPTPRGIQQLLVCGKVIQGSSRVGYALNMLRHCLESYGERSIKAANMDGNDWKALSHAHRLGMELKELLTENRITIPNTFSETTKLIKYGKLSNEEVGSLLGKLLDEVAVLKELSNLPDTPDERAVNKVILDIIEHHLN